MQPLAFSKELLPVGSQRDEYVGALVNAWIAQGGHARGACAGEAYVDVGTVRGYRDAVVLLSAGELDRASCVGRSRST